MKALQEFARELLPIMGLGLLGTAGVAFLRVGFSLLLGGHVSLQLIVVAVLLAGIGGIAYWAARRLWAE